MPSIHAIRWIKNLKLSNNELYWFDITNKGSIENLVNVTQFTDWKTRKIPHIKGEYTLLKKFPIIHFSLKHLFEVTENEYLEKIIKKIQPDVIHSFEMQSCCYPILKIMNKFPSIKWIYSCWGSDLFYYQNIKYHNLKIKKVLKRVNYLHTDNIRDLNIACQLGFKGNHTGVIPGGSGYNLKEYSKYKMPIETRSIILVKGYQHQFGRALNIIKALANIINFISSYQVVVFGAHNEVIHYIKSNNLPFKTFGRNELSQIEVVKLMGKSKLYIGNNSSDGMPNTLLEAIIMNAFPIQSNPGNVTAEIIKDGENGLLIQNHNDIKSIQDLIILALRDEKKFIGAAKINTKIAVAELDYHKIKLKIEALYNNLS